MQYSISESCLIFSPEGSPWWDLRDPFLLFFSNLLFVLLRNQSVCVSERAVDSQHHWAPLYIHLCNPLASYFGLPSTHTAPLPSYILCDDTFPQLPYQCTGMISQKLLAWGPDDHVWEGRGRTWKSNTFVWTVKIMKNSKAAQGSSTVWAEWCITYYREELVHF